MTDDAGDESNGDADESADEQNQYGGQSEGEDAVEQTERREGDESEGEDTDERSS